MTTTRGFLLAALLAVTVSLLSLAFVFFLSHRELSERNWSSHPHLVDDGLREIDPKCFEADDFYGCINP